MRGLAPALFALAVASLPKVAQAEVPTCTASPADAVAIAPADADFVVAVQLQDLSSKSQGQQFLGLAQLDLQLGEWLRLRERCFAPGSGHEVQSLSVAASESGEFVWLLQGPGVNQQAQLDCMADWFARRDRGVRPWTSVQSAGGECVRHYVATSKRQLSALAVGDQSLALTSSGWSKEVLAALIDGKTRAADLEEAAKLSRHPDAQIWAAGTLHREAGYLAQVPWRDTVRNFALRAELGEGLSLRFAVETSDFARAVTRAVAGELPARIGRWEELGIPRKVMSKLEISTARELFLARWELTRPELQQLALAMKGRLEGGGLL